MAVIGMRWPTPNGPPVQPVFTSQTLAPCWSSFSPSIRAYTRGGCGRNGAPKHVEKVGCGSVTPSSVPASFAVNPERNQYIAWSRERRAIGGRTAKASAARKTTELGCPARFVGSAFAMRSSLYAARVFSVFDVVVEIDDARLVDRDVLEDRPERPRRPPDLRLGLRREPDHLGVAAALDVEDAARRSSRARRRRSASGPGRPTTSSSRSPRARRRPPPGRPPRRRSPSSASAGRPRAGRRSFISVKIPFLISPA